MTQVITPPALPKEVPGVIKNGIYTVIGPKGHRTVKVSTVTDGPLAGRRIVYVMTGSDNLFNYTGVAFLNSRLEDHDVVIQESSKDEDGIISYVDRTIKIPRPVDTLQIWKRMQGTELHKVVSAWLRILTNGIEGYRYEEALNCIKCNRLLTNPDSIEAGIGPICAQGGIDE